MYKFLNIKLIVRVLNVLFLRIFFLTFLAITFFVGITAFYFVINIFYSKDVSLFFYLSIACNITMLFSQYYFIITVICAILFTFAYLHIKSELYIVKSCGSSFYNVMFYFLPSFAFIFFLTLSINNYIVPYAQKNIIISTKKCLYDNPIAFIKEKDFTNFFNKMNIYIESKDNNVMQKVIIYKLNKDSKVTFTAESGIINGLEDKTGIQIVLEEGYVYIDYLYPNGTIYRSIRNNFSQQVINLNFDEILKNIFDVNDISCLDSLELIKKINAFKKVRDKNIDDNIMQYTNSSDTYSHNYDLDIDLLQCKNKNVKKTPMSVKDMILENKKYYMQIFSDNIIYQKIQSYNAKENAKFSEAIHNEKNELFRRNSIVLMCCILFLIGIARGWLLSCKNYIPAMLLAICFAGIYYVMTICLPQENLFNIILPVYVYILLFLFYCIFASRDRWLYKKVRR